MLPIMIYTVIFPENIFLCFTKWNNINLSHVPFDLFKINGKHDISTLQKQKHIIVVPMNLIFVRLKHDFVIIICHLHITKLYSERRFCIHTMDGDNLFGLLHSTKIFISESIRSNYPTLLYLIRYRRLSSFGLFRLFSQTFILLKGRSPFSFSRYAEGDTPITFVNIREKYAGSSNPSFVAISLNFKLVNSIY